MISHCPSCAKQIEVPEAARGKKVRCSGCQAVFAVEAAAAPKSPQEVKKPANAPKKPEADDAESPFSFEGPSPLADATEAGAEPSNLDFSTQEPQLNVGVRLKVRRAAGLMHFGVFICILQSLLTTIVALIISGGNPIFYMLGNIPAVIVMIFGIVVLLGSQALAELRSRVLCIVAGIFCLLIALPGFGSLSLEGYAFFVAGPHLVRTPTACVVVVSSIYCFLGGVYALLIVFRADVTEAFRQSAEAQRRAEGRGTMLAARAVRGYCIATAAWLLLLAFWMTLSYGLAVGALVYRFWDGTPPILWAIIGAAGLFYALAMLLVLAGAGATVALKAPTITKIGGFVCVIVAFLSYFSGLYLAFVMMLLFLVPADFVTPRDQTVRILVAIETVIVAIQLVLAFLCFRSAMRTARLVSRFQKGNVDQPAPSGESD